MQQKPEGMDFTWKELITQLDTRVIAIVRMDPEDTLDVPLPSSPSPIGFGEPFKVEEGFDHDLQTDSTDAQSNTPPPTSPGPDEILDAPKPQTVTIPLVDFYISLENLGWLVDKLAKEFENVQEIEPFRVNGWHGFGFAGQMPPGAKAYKPYLLHEEATGRLVLVSRPGFMTACLSNSGGIRKDLNFQKAVEGLPNSGNSFTYFSPDIVDTVGGIIIELAEGEEDAQKALPMALGMLGYLKKPQAAVYRNQDDGFLISANQVFSHKGNFFMAMLPNPLVMGTMWFTALKGESSMDQPAFSITPLDDEDAILKMKQLGLIYQEYLQETDGAHVPADTAGVHGWAIEIANKTGFDDASIFRVDGDLSVEGHFGDLADSVRDKSFPGSPFSLTLVAGIPSDAKVENVPLAWTRGLQTNGRWVFDSPFSGEGGHVLFLDGRVEYFLEAIDEGALVDYKTGKPTLDITKAIPPTARVLEYAVPELDLPHPVPEDSLPKVQVDSPALPVEPEPVLETPEALKLPPAPSDPDTPPSPSLSVLVPKSVSKVLTQGPELSEKKINPEFFARGKKLYNRSGACVTCHQPSGKGLTDIFPPLAGADWGLEPDDVVVRIVLNGLQGPTRILGKDYSVPCIPTIWREWPDTDIAAVITYTRNAWGNSGPVVSAETVKRIRSEVGTRAPWTVKELEVYQNQGVSSDEDSTRLPPILESSAPELKSVGQINEAESTKVPEPVPVGPDPEVASPPKPKLPQPPE